MNSQMTLVALTFLAALALAVGEPEPSTSKMSALRREGPPRENPAAQISPPRPDTNELNNDPNPNNEDMNAESTFILGLGGWGGYYGWGGWGGWGNRYPYYGGGYYNYRPYNNYYGGWYNRPYGGYGGWGW